MIGAYRSSGLIEQNRALVRAADEDVAGAVAALRPVLRYIASVDYSHREVEGPLGVPTIQEETNYSFGLNAEWLLYNSGARRYAVDRAKEAVLAAREALRGVEQQVLLRAVRAYFDVVEKFQPDVVISDFETTEEMISYLLKQKIL